MNLFGSSPPKNDVDSHLQTVDGERSPASINQGVGISKKLTFLFFFTCAVLLMLFLGWRYFSNVAEQRRLASEEATRIDETQKVEQALPALNVPRPPAAPPPPPVVVSTATSPKELSKGPIASQYAPPPPPTEKRELTPEELALQRKMSSPVAIPIETSLAHSIPKDSDAPRKTTSDDALGVELVGTATPQASAKKLGDRNFLITKGTFVEGVLETAMSSDVPGMVKALVTSDVYSSNGRVVLLERGTRLVGEYRGQLRNGQSRVFVLWTRAETPQGIIVNLDSGSADELGRSGMDGHIDSHWGTRLGAALLLSTWSDAMQMLVDSQRNTSGDNNYITYDNSARTARNMASEALGRYIDIPPTLYKNQGDPIRIFVARDLDFSKVYKLALNENGIAGQPQVMLVPADAELETSSVAPPQYYLTNLPPCPECPPIRGVR